MPNEHFKRLSHPDEQPARSSETAQKKRYHKPNLTTYGLVRNLTQAGSRGGVERVGMGMMMTPMGMMGMG